MSSEGIFMPFSKYYVKGSIKMGTKRRDKGTGTVYYSKNRKKWIGQFLVGYNAQGKKRLKTISGDTQKEVKEKMKKEQAKLITGTYVDLSLITIPQMASAINDEKYQMNIINDSTYYRNKKAIQIIEKSAIGGLPLQKLNEMNVKSFLLSQKHYSNSTINKIYGALNSSMEKALKQHIISYNFVKDISKPKSDKQNKKIRALTIEEQRKVIECLNQDNVEPYRTMLLLEMFTGMRMGEICALDYNSVNEHFNTIVVERSITRDSNDKFTIGETTKTQASMRKVKMSDEVRNLIIEYKNNFYVDNANHLFFSKKGNMTTPNGVNNYFKRLIVRYGIADNVKDYNQHMLRHTYATRCIEGGMNASTLQKKLGHNDISVTLNTYTDIFSEFEDTQDELVKNYLFQQGINAKSIV